MTIKIKIAALLAVVALLGGGISALTLGDLVRNGLRATVGDQMFTQVAHTADEVDDKLEVRLAYLEALANEIDPGLLQQPAALHDHLAGRSAARTLFDVLVVTDGDGVAVADLSPRGGFLGTDYSDRDWYQRARTLRRPLISDPVVGRVSRRPQVVLAVPIVDARGDLAGVLTGTLELHATRILGDINASRIGHSGYFYVVSNDGRFIAHRDAARIMQPVPAAGLDASLDRAHNGYEGTLEGTDSHGLHGLFSFKRMRTTGWIVAAVVPADEAFVAVDEVIDITYLLALVGLSILLLLVWLVLRYLLQPLEGLRTVMARVVDGADPATLSRSVVGSRDEVGAVAAGFNSMLDAIEQRDRQLRESFEQLRGLTEVLSYGVCIADAEGRIIFLNPAAAQLLHWHEDQALGHDIGELLQCCDSDGNTGPDGPSPWAAAIATGATQTCAEVHLVDRDGGRVPVDLVISPICPDGHVERVVITFHDISERLEATRRISFMALHDSLTGLPNRNMLLDRINHALAQCDRYGYRAAVLYLDLDGFKAINDNHGHAAGDLVLQECARRIAGKLRAEDSVARVGGDEFVALLLRVTDHAAAQQVATAVLDRVCPPIDLDGNAVAVTVSIGVALYPDDVATAEALIESADTAMYQAKRSGKNRIGLAAPA